MNESNIRMTEGNIPPSDRQIARWIGKEAYTYWTQVTQLIDQAYPGVFVPEWLFGGKKHGWFLRYKKGRSFCTLIPEKDRFAVLMVFGAEERAKVDAVRQSLSQSVQKEYDKATTYHDGKWVLLTINSNRMVEDAQKLLAVKRKPKDESRG